MALYINISDLKKHRLHTSYGVKAFAQYINVSTRTIQNIEKGENVNISKIRSYVKGLNEITGKCYKVILN